MKPRSRMLEVPGTSVSVPATRPAVQDSAVATSRFLRLQTSRRSRAALTMSSSSIVWSSRLFRPGQPDGGRRISSDAFAAAGEAELLAGRGLDRNPVRRQPCNAGHGFANGVAMRADLRRLAD